MQSSAFHTHTLEKKRVFVWWDIKFRKYFVQAVNNCSHFYDVKIIWYDDDDDDG